MADKQQSSAYNGVLLTLIFLGMLYIIFSLFNPLTRIAIAREKNIVEKAAKLANVSTGEFQYMAELGKTQDFKDIEALKKLSTYNAEVYKDAKKGDRAIAFANNMVIYREGSKNLIYNGESPAQKQLKDQQAAVQSVVDAMAKEGIVKTGETPQVSTVVNADQLKANPFYANAQNGDMVFSFGNQGVIVLFNPTNKKIINAARVSLAPLTAASPTGEAKKVTPTPKQ